MPNWKKVIVSGSDAALNSLYAPSITGSLLGTASYAIYAETASVSLATTENRIIVMNKSGATITKGMVVHLTGSNNSSDTPYVITASYESDSLSANTLGIAYQTITDNSTGYVVTEGVITGIDVTGYISGQVLYLGATGSIIGTAPTAPLHSVRLGQVVRDSPSNNGSIYVRIDNGYELGELHDVKDTTTTSSYGDLLVKSGSVWINSKQLTGSYAITGSLTATSFTGSLFGTASYATQAGNASTIDINVFGTPVESYLLMSNVVATTGVAIGGDADLRYNSSTNTLTAVNISATSLTGSLLGTASYATQALSSSFALTTTSASYALNATTATTASYVLNAVSSSFASTASFVNTLNQSVLITGSLTVGATTAGVSENTLTLGPRDNGSEGGQIMLQAPGGTYTSASMWDNYANQTRLLRGSNAGSDALVASFNMHTKQMQLAAYNNVSAFPGTAAAFLAVDTSGNLITTSSAGGGGGGVTINNNVDNYLITATGTLNTLNGESNLQFNGSSLTVTGQITASGAVISQANGAMYFRGGDDAEFWDINVANTVGIYGQQTQTVAGLKLGSAGATLYGSGSRFGIATTSPVATLDINGNLYVASGITGSLLGTASYATQALSASYAPSTPTFPYTGDARISGSLGVTGSFNLQTFNGLTDVTALDFGGVTRIINDVQGGVSINADDRDLYDSSNINSVSWEGRRLIDSIGSQSVNWNDRMLKIDNGPGAFTVNWGSALLRDTGSTNSVDWQNRITIDAATKTSIDWQNRTTIDTGNKTSIDWQNRQLKDSSGNENLNWSSGINITGSTLVSGSLTVTGSLTVSGSSTFTNIGPARFSGSFGVQGALIPGFPPMIPDIGPYDAIRVDDVNYERKLYGSPDLGASASVDFGNRDLSDATGAGVFNWSGFASTIDSRLYINQTINSTSRDALITNVGTGGHLLNDVTFDATVNVNDLCYLDPTNVWFPVDQGTNSASRLLGICMGYDPMTYVGQVLLEGDVVVTTGTGYPIVQGANYGLTVYIAQGAGTIMDTAQPASGIIRRLGYCYHSNGGTEWIMKFRPSNDWA